MNKKALILEYNENIRPALVSVVGIEWGAIPYLPRSEQEAIEI